MKNILLPTDFSDLARQTYGAAASLARAHGARLLLAHQAEPLPPLFYEGAVGSADIDRYHQRLQATLEEESRLAEFQGLDVVPHLLHPGTENGSLLDFAANQRVDLIIMSTHGHSGLVRNLLGSFAELVARHATVPVLVFRENTAAGDSYEPRSILVPFDFSENSQVVFPILRTLREGSQGLIRVLHVFPEVSSSGEWGDVKERLRVSREAAAEQLEELEQLCQRELPGLKVELDSRYGDPHREILKDARVSASDLIVMATHGRTGMERLYFGSVTEKVLRTSPCAVLIVRPASIRQEGLAEDDAKSG